jgi:hypothetical protein
MRLQLVKCWKPLFYMILIITISRPELAPTNDLAQRYPPVHSDCRTTPQFYEVINAVMRLALLAQL